MCLGCIIPVSAYFGQCLNFFPSMGARPYIKSSQLDNKCVGSMIVIWVFYSKYQRQLQSQFRKLPSKKRRFRNKYIYFYSYFSNVNELKRLYKNYFQFAKHSSKSTFFSPCSFSLFFSLANFASILIAFHNSSVS